MFVGSELLHDGGCRFSVWAPFRNSVELHLIAPEDRIVPMVRDDRGYWQTTIKGTGAGARYMFRLDNGDDLPDPASRFQPEGVHRASEVTDHAFHWTDDAWQGLPLQKYIFYELHVGTFSPEGTFVGAIPFLDDLAGLGVTAIELMPVAQFPGERNWGYDGAYPFAVQNSYGGPAGLKQLVDACHARGLAVVMDVVYNHFGPEGSYVGQYGPYFTDHYKTPWGNAMNFDGPYSDDVRNFFTENALVWLREYHCDGLRLDAIHAIYDLSAHPFLQELAEMTDRYSIDTGRRHYLIAESDLNDVRVIRSRETGGFGIDAQWSDDLHHALQTLVLPEKGAYYVDFGSIADLGKALAEGFVYSGQYSRFRKRRHGNSSRDLPAHQFVVCTQNHDQVGNRILGERLCSRVPREKLMVFAAVVLLSPNLPLLFMGEEYAEEAPFLYFVSHSDTALIEAIRKGRKEEFSAFMSEGEGLDPVDPEAFQRSKLNWALRHEGDHAAMLAFYTRLIALRKENRVLSELTKEGLEVMCFEEQKVLSMVRGAQEERILSLFSFADHDTEGAFAFPAATGWTKVLDSADEQWHGPGAGAPMHLDGARCGLRPYNAVVYHRQE